MHEYLMHQWSMYEPHPQLKLSAIARQTQWSARNTQRNNIRFLSGTATHKFVNYNSQALPSVFTYGLILPADITCDKIFHISTLEVIQYSMYLRHKAIKNYMYSCGSIINLLPPTCYMLIQYMPETQGHQGLLLWFNYQSSPTHMLYVMWYQPTIIW